MSVHNSLHGLDYKLKRKQLFSSAFVVCSPSVLHSFLLVPLGTRCHVLSGYGSLKGTWTAFRRPTYREGRNYKGIDKDKMGNRRFNLQRLGRMPSVWRWPADKIIYVCPTWSPHVHCTSITGQLVKAMHSNV